MSDLVERLLTTSTQRTYDSAGRAYDYPEHLPREAAAEITRLVEENRRLEAERDQANAAWSVCNNARNASRLRAEKAEAENRRLREALEKIDSGYGPNHLSTYAKYIARSALTSEQPVDGGKQGEA